jgi:hypothetical protein
MEPTIAGRLMRELHDERPLVENIDLALAIVLASILGPGDEPVGEPQGEPQTTTVSPGESSVSPIIMEPVQ